MKKSKKKSTVSEPKRGRGNPRRGLKVAGTDEKFHRNYPGEDPKANKYPEPKPDPEKELPEPKDAASKHKFPPPKKHPVFRKTWMDFIDNVTGRDNFKDGHLHSLEILCDLHVEYQELHEFIRKNGRSYQSYGRAGMQWKFYPEVGQLKNVQSQIKDYMKMMGLLLKRDHGTANPNAGGKDEWA